MEATFTTRTNERLDALVPLAIMVVVLMMVLPIPPFALDILISLNIALSVVTLVSTMYITRPVQLSVFPSLLLLLTLLRLSLNISSTRLILLRGQEGTQAAGEVIEAFGSFVVGGNFIIGIVIFILLIAIQYVVINHGAVRISEVTARFTLDALPGKQMSIDSDLNAGLIDETEARRRRAEINREAEFYGAMDGAVRFTQRDAIASILITGINIIAGFLIGLLQHAMAFTEALETYTTLTVGDGLVTVVPALLISVSGGIITTRAAGETRLGADFGAQVLRRPEPLLIASGVLGAMAALPGLPTLPFLLLGGGMGGLGWNLRQQVKQSQERQTALNSMTKAAPVGLQLSEPVNTSLPTWVALGISCHIKLTSGVFTLAFVPNEPLLVALAAAEGVGAAPSAIAEIPAEPTGIPELAFSNHARRNLQMLLDVDLDLSVSFGRATLLLQEVMKLSSGSIVELDRSANDPVDVLVNNSVVARGEVVVVDGNYGIRITEVVSPRERIRSLL